MQSAIDTGKAVADISADERFYNRSVRIRRKVMEWMAEKVGRAVRHPRGDGGSGCATCEVLDALLAEMDLPVQPAGDAVPHTGAFELLRHQGEERVMTPKPARGSTVPRLRQPDKEPRKSRSLVSISKTAPPAAPKTGTTAAPAKTPTPSPGAEIVASCFGPTTHVLKVGVLG